MGKTRRELLASVDSVELTEWKAFAGLEPFGPAEEDFRFGRLNATIANFSQMSEGGLVAADFMSRPPPKPDQSMESMKSAAIKITAGMRGEINGKKIGE